MIVFIEGGSKSGKSLFAQDVSVKLSTKGHLWYLATMEPHDEEDLARIARHRRERDGLGFETAEWGRNIESHKKEIDCKGTYLVDSITTLLTNEMFRNMSDSSVDLLAPQRVLDGLSILSQKAENVVFVSDNIYGDGICFDEWTNEFRKGLAYIDREICKKADTVYEFVNGNRIKYKGEEIL